MKRYIIGLILVLALVAALAGCASKGLFSNPFKNTTLQILMYHEFVPDGQKCNDWTTTESQFRADLEWLTEQGYHFVLPSELAAGEPLPKKAVMLTFDDGYASNYKIAYPLLREYNAKAVIALITKRIVDQKAGFLTWDMCREMLQSGIVEIGSHGHDVHIRAGQGVARDEGESQADYEKRVFPDIQTSIDLIEQELGTTPQFFAYPYGRTDEWITDFIHSHFDISVTTTTEVADLSGGLHELPRHNVNAKTTLSNFMS